MRTILIDVLNSAELNGERHLLQREEHFTNDIDARGTTRYVWRDTDGVVRFDCSTWEDAQIIMDRSRTMQPHTPVPVYQHRICALAQSQRRWYRLEKVADEYVWFTLRGESVPSLGARFRHNSISNAVAEMRRVQEDERAAAAQARIFGDAEPTVGAAETRAEGFDAPEYRGDFMWRRPEVTGARPTVPTLSSTPLLMDVANYAVFRGELLMLHREAPPSDPTAAYYLWRKTNGSIWIGLDFGGRVAYYTYADAMQTLERARSETVSHEISPLEARRVYATARWDGQWFRLQMLDDVDQYGWTPVAVPETNYIWRPFNAVAQAIEFMRNEQLRVYEEAATAAPDETVWGDWPTPEGVLYNESLLRRAERYTMDPHEFVAATRRAPLVDPDHGGPIPTERPFSVWGDLARVEEGRADRIYPRVQEAFQAARPYNADDLAGAAPIATRVLDELRRQYDAAYPPEPEQPMTAEPIDLEEVFGTMRANRAPVYPPAQTPAPMHTKNVNKP